MPVPAKITGELRIPGSDAKGLPSREDVRTAQP